MALAAVLTQVVAVVAAALAVAALVIVGPARLREAARRLRPRLRAVAPSLLALVLVLVLNGIVRNVGIDLSWLVGINITGAIYAIEGQFVAWLQSHATPLLTDYFAAVYVYGYAFLLTFPVVAYLALDDPEPFQEMARAYVVNYGVGLLCYVVFIAYGPRNLMPDLVEALLYTTWPQSQLLTSRVNANTNVFPSLHSSLSITVALLAYRTRSVYPRWVPIATVLAASVVVSTMYLGIHWAVDVVAGAVLAVGSVYVAARMETPDAVAARWRTIGRYASACTTVFDDGLDRFRGGER